MLNCSNLLFIYSAIINFQSYFNDVDQIHMMEYVFDTIKEREP